MSLYNMLFGRRPGGQLLLAMLNLTEGDVGRFRDCFLRRGEKDASPEEIAKSDLRIVVYTRNGGGNRDDYEAVTEALQSLPTYLTDYDDDFDCTYASYEFKVPEEFKPTAEELYVITEGASQVSPQEAFRTLIDNLQKGNMADPAAARALDVGKKIFGQMEESLKQGGGKIEV